MDNLDLARWQFAITTVYHFLFVPVTIGLSALVAWYHTPLGAAPARGRPAAGQVLRQALHDQLRPRPGDRHRPGVPVRHELVGLQPLRRRHLRGAAGHRGAAGVLPRVDLPRAVDLRLGSHPGEAARRLHVDRPRRHPAVGLLHPGRQLVHAEPGRLPLQPRDQPRRAHRLRGRADQQGPARDVPPRGHRGLHGRRRHGDGRVALAPAPARRRRGRRDVPQGDPARCRRRPRRRPRRGGHRRHPGQDHDRGPADEDGRRRGALRQLRRQRALQRCSRSGRSTAPRRSSPSPCPVC